MKRNDFSGSWFEMWNPHRGMSRSHAWSSGPTALLPRMVLGIEPAKTGWKEFHIKPELFDLNWASATVSTLSGDIKAEVQRHENGSTGYVLDITIPLNTLGHITIPYPSKNSSIIVNGDNIPVSAETKDFVLCDLSAGEWKIEVI